MCHGEVYVQILTNSFDFDATSSMEWKSSRQKIKCDRQLSAFTLLLHFTLAENWKVSHQNRKQTAAECRERAQMMSERLSNLEFSPEKWIRYNCCTLFAFYSILAEPCRVFFCAPIFRFLLTLIDIYCVCLVPLKNFHRAFAIFSFFGSWTRNHIINICNFLTFCDQLHIYYCIFVLFNQ